jgi:hypothetical protein
LKSGTQRTGPHPPIGKRCKSQGPSTTAANPTQTRKWGKAQLFVDSDADELEDPNDAVAAGRALAAAAAASAAGAAGGAGQ